MESTNNLPIPFQPNMYSTKTAPDNIEANQPEAVVKTEVKEFLKAWTIITRLSERPLDLAVLIKSEERVSKSEFLVKLIITAMGLIPNVKTGRIKFLILIYSPLPKSSISYKLPTTFKFVNQLSLYANNHMTKIAEKKEGNDIPKELKKIQNLSKKLFFLTAQIIPIGIEIQTANKIDKKAKTTVLGKTSNIISSTSFSLK